MTAQWVAIQRNPMSGSGRGRSQLLLLASELKRLGLKVRMFSNRERMDAWVREKSVSNSLRCIVAAGGDGTVGNVINRCPSIPVTILPLGTENLLARYFQLTLDGKRLAQIIADNHQRTIDLGQIGATRFTLMASAGLDADVIHRLHATRTGTISRLSYVQTILKSLRKYQYPELEVFLDDSPTAHRARLVVVVNIARYAFGIKVARQADPADGLFEVRLFERGGAWNSMRYLLAAFSGRHEERSDVQCLQAQKVKIQLAGQQTTNAPLQIDGDPIGLTPVEIEMVPKACTIVVPARNTAQ